MLWLAVREVILGKQIFFVEAQDNARWNAQIRG